MPVSVAKWLSRVVCTPEQATWLGAFEDEVQSVEIAYELYARNAARLSNQLTPAALERTNARALHHARAFVSAVRRAALLFELVNLSAFPSEVSRVIKEQRKRKAAFFKRYVLPRNMSEHIANEAQRPVKHVLKGVVALQPAKRTWHPIISIMALKNSELAVPGADSAPVTKTARNTVLEARNQIIRAVKTHLPPRTNEFFGLFPVDVRGFDS
jgi:hypothetical protein